MSFETVLSAHEAFYQALASANLDLMTQVWSQSEEAVCIHPLWPPLIGHRSIIASWTEMFRRSATMTVGTEILSEHQQSDSCIHLVAETLTAPDGQTASPVLATNAYQLTDQGWLMIVHHASPTAVEAAGRPNHALH